MPTMTSSALLNSVATNQQREFGSFAEMIGALTTAIDLAEGNREGHTMRTCIIGMKIGRRVGLDAALLSDLYYALLLKDIAGSHTQTLDMALTGQGGLLARRLLREGRSGMSWRETARAALDLHYDKPFIERTEKRLRFFQNRRKLRAETVGVRCTEAESLLQTLGVSPGTRSAILAMDEQWNGAGAPKGLRGMRIPVLAQIVKLSQTMELFHAQGGSKCVVPKLHRRCRGWFDPGLVAAATRLFESPSAWWSLDQKNLLAYAVGLEPKEHLLAANGVTIDRVCEAFAAVADARSNYGRDHSSQVAELAVHIARVMKMSEAQITSLRRAALLHGVGKLVVPRHVLERQGSLSEQEVAVLQTYPTHTYDILSLVPEFQEIAHIAASTHERLDGSGYPNHMAGDQLSLSARILAVSDVAEALASERSFRRKYSGQQIYKILMELAPHQLDVHCVNALLHNSVMSLVA